MRKPLSFVIVLVFLFIRVTSASGEVKKEYYPSGKLKSEVNVIDGKREGIAKAYYKSGKLGQETNYKNDVREGIEREYHENGVLWSEVNYINDKKEGNAKRYYESGKLRSERNYKNGKIVSRKDYDETGKLEVDFGVPAQ